MKSCFDKNIGEKNGVFLLKLLQVFEKMCLFLINANQWPEKSQKSQKIVI
jgi:hypothetical protein